MKQLKTKTINNVLWSFVSQFLSKGITILTTIVLAWFLVPEDFSLIAMIAVFIALSSVLIDGGLGQALIRQLKVTDLELSTVFWTNILLSIMVYIAIFVSAPLIAKFYNEPKLIELIRVVSLSVFFQSLVVVQKCILYRGLKFKLEVKVILPSVALSSFIAIILAYFDYGIWALICQILLNSFFLFIFYWLLNLWRPSFQFSYMVLTKLWGFGKFILLESIVGAVFKNMYLIALPKFFAAGPVGLYFLAEKIKDILVGLIINSVQTVTYPALSKIQEDQTRLKQGYRKVIVTTTFLMFPVVFFTAALVPILFEIMLPEKWKDAAIYLQLMCLASVLYPLHALNINILQVKGRSNLVFYIGLFKRVVNVLVFIYTIQFGIIWVIVGQIALSIIHYLPNAYYSSKLIQYSIKEQLIDFLPALFLSAAIGSLIYYLQIVLKLAPLIEFLGFSLFALALYFVGAYILRLQGFKLTQELFLERFREKM